MLAADGVRREAFHLAHIVDPCRDVVNEAHLFTDVVQRLRANGIQTLGIHEVGQLVPAALHLILDDVGGSIGLHDGDELVFGFF